MGKAPGKASKDSFRKRPVQPRGPGAAGEPVLGLPVDAATLREDIQHVVVHDRRGRPRHPRLPHDLEGQSRHVSRVNAFGASHPGPLSPVGRAAVPSRLRSSRGTTSPSVQLGTREEWEGGAVLSAHHEQSIGRIEGLLRGGGLARRGGGGPLTGASRAVRHAGGEAAQPLGVHAGPGRAHMRCAAGAWLSWLGWLEPQ